MKQKMIRKNIPSQRLAAPDQQKKFSLYQKSMQLFSLNSGTDFVLENASSQNQDEKRQVQREQTEKTLSRNVSYAVSGHHPDRLRFRPILLKHILIKELFSRGCVFFLLAVTHFPPNFISLSHLRHLSPPVYCNHNLCCTVVAKSKKGETIETYQGPRMEKLRNLTADFTQHRRHRQRYEIVLLWR